VVVFVASVIPRNISSPIGENVVFLKTNGLHLEFVVPYKHSLFDWSDIIPISFSRNRKHTPLYITFGMGDKDFYLNTDEWKDVEASILLKALFLPTEAVLRVRFIDLELSENKSTVAMMLTDEQFVALQKNIIQKFVFTENTPNLLHGKASSANQLFFQAKGSYSLINTCNTWINETLVKSKIRACLWTTFDKAILWQERFVLDRSLKID